MLSRVANTLYWMVRYLERADNLWQELNDLYLFSRSQEAAVLLRIDPSRFYQNIRRAAFTINGIATSTTRLNQGWEFMDLGRQLERADKTTRFLDISSYLSQGEDISELAANKAAALHWTAILRSCGAIGAFRTERLGFTPFEVIGFLVFSIDFPRAVRYCVDRIDISLHRISGSPRGSYASTAERISGKLLAQLNFGSPGEVFEAGLHEYLDQMQSLFNQIGNEIFETYVLMPDKILERPTGLSEPAFATHAASNLEAQMQQQQ